MCGLAVILRALFDCWTLYQPPCYWFSSPTRRESCPACGHGLPEALLLSTRTRFLLDNIRLDDDQRGATLALLGWR